MGYEIKVFEKERLPASLFLLLLPVFINKKFKSIAFKQRQYNLNVHIFYMGLKK